MTEAGAVDGRRRSIGKPRVTEDFERGTVCATARQTQVHSSQRRAWNAGAGFQFGAGVVALGRHADATKVRLIEPRQRPPIARDEIRMNVTSALNHPSPHSKLTSRACFLNNPPSWATHRGVNAPLGCA